MVRLLVLDLGSHNTASAETVIRSWVERTPSRPTKEGCTDSQEL